MYVRSGDGHLPLLWIAIGCTKCRRSFDSINCQRGQAVVQGRCLGRCCVPEKRASNVSVLVARLSQTSPRKQLSQLHTYLLIPRSSFSLPYLILSSFPYSPSSQRHAIDMDILLPGIFRSYRPVFTKPLPPQLHLPDLRPLFPSTHPRPSSRRHGKVEELLKELKQLQTMSRSVRLLG